MKTYRRLLPALLIVLTASSVFLACSKYKDTPYVDPGLPADKMVTASVQGRVLDQNGVPVQGATVTSDTASTTTDLNGNFQFKNIAMSTRFGYVKVTATGFFAGSRSIIVSAGSANEVTIHLIPRTSSGTFPAASGGVIVVQAGDTVSFAAGVIVTASTNAAYSGTVHAFAAYLNPTDGDLSNKMPGDLRGIGSDGKETALQTFGMMVVELEGDAGEKLQIASGKQATITMTIPDTLQQSAPTSIPLWYFNDTTGKWIEQGAATKTGKTYVGQVGHFTYWNCDVSMGVVNFTVTLKDTHGNALPYTPIMFLSTTTGGRGGRTDANGYAAGLIPKGQSLSFYVLNPCGQTVFGESLGVLAQDLNMGTLVVDADTSILTLTGTVVDCNNNPVTNGFVDIQLEGLDYRGTVTNGAFSTTIVKCNRSNEQAVITAADLTQQTVGSSITTTIKSGTMALGQLSACSSSSGQFINITINGTSYNWNDVSDVFTYYGGASGWTSEYVLSSSSGNWLSMHPQSALTATGSYTLGTFTLSAPPAYYGAHSSDSYQVQLAVTTFGPESSGYIIGTLSGNVLDSVSRNTYPITGSLKMLRTQ